MGQMQKNLCAPVLTSWRIRGLGVAEVPRTSTAHMHRFLEAGVIPSPFAGTVAT
jgi:hypothetical protein